MRPRMISLRPLIGTLASVFLLSACHLSAVRVQQVDAHVAKSRAQLLDCEADQIDNCSENSPLMTLAADDLRKGTHHLTLLEIGEDALKLRIHLIRAARHSIDLQNFILRRDDTGELLLNELLNAARRGVKVRLLLDQMFTVSDLKYLVKLTLAHVNFEVKFYNPSFYKAKMAKHDWISAVACCFRRFNQRMHTKLLVVDEMVGVIGGRNIADRYFDYDTNYNFKDRDVAVFGVTAVEMRQSFAAFWESPKSVPVQHLRDVARELLKGAVTEPEPYHPAPRLLPLLAQITDVQHVRALFIEPAMQVERLEYFSDRPRKAAFPEDEPKQDITQELDKVFEAARHSIVIQSPYMVLSSKARRLFRELR